MKLGVYVGSFNPVHNGHIKVANYLVNNNLVDKVLILPTPAYWDKQNFVDIKHRINMLKFFETDKIIIDDIHNNYPYTYQVMDSIKKDNPDSNLYLVIGADNLEKLKLWKNIDKIIKNYYIIVLKRGNMDYNRYLIDFDTNRFIIVDNFNYLNVSSTDIRNNLDNENLDTKVLKYIKENKLYR